MNIVEEILGRGEFKEKPPVLLDIGASGYLHTDWRKIANYSVCIAFDADKRDFNYIENEKSNFRELHIFNKIAAEHNGKDKFYLTRFPYCSSALVPDGDKLKEWSFSDMFQVDKIIELETMNLPMVLKTLSLDYVDWFKTDSQGTDLRLFRGLGAGTIPGVIIAEFEPGIMDAYLNEDKMHAVMSFMESQPFWLSDLIINGPQKINISNLKTNFNKIEQKVLHFPPRRSAFWGEMTYINTFKQKKTLSKRHLLLGWVFCTIKKQHGFALDLAEMGKSLFDEPIFEILKSRSIGSIRKSYWKIPFGLAVRACRKFFFV